MELYQAGPVYSTLGAHCGARKFCSLFILPDPEFGTLALQNEPQHLHSPGDLLEAFICVQVLYFRTLIVMSHALELLKGDSPPQSLETVLFFQPVG